MIWRRHPREAGRRNAVFSDVPAARRAGIVARVGAPSLIALASALAVLAVLSCALFVPGFVLPADAGTTSTTAAAPAGSPGANPATTPTEPVPAEPAQGRLLATLSWGEGAGQVGLTQPKEGLTRGPEALAVSPDGRVAVLDSVNHRLVLMGADGSVSDTVPLALKEPRFLAVDDTSLYVLDADADRRLVHLDWKGASLGTGSIPALEDVVTGLFVTADGPCLEVAHDHTFLVRMEASGADLASGVQLAAAGRSDQGSRPVKTALHDLAGRPVDRDLGKAAKLTFDPKDGMKLKRFDVNKKSLKGSQTQSAALKFTAGRSVEHLVSVDGDGRGGLIVGARMLHSKTDSAGAPSLVIGRMPADAGQSNDADVTLTNTLTLTDSPYAYVGQPYVIAPDGRVFQPVASEKGYSILVHTLPGFTAPTQPDNETPATADLKEVQP